MVKHITSPDLLIYSEGNYISSGKTHHDTIRDHGLCDIKGHVCDFQRRRKVDVVGLCANRLHVEYKCL